MADKFEVIINFFGPDDPRDRNFFTTGHANIELRINDIAQFRIGANLADVPDAESIYHILDFDEWAEFWKPKFFDGIIYTEALNRTPSLYKSIVISEEQANALMAYKDQVKSVPYNYNLFSSSCFTFASFVYSRVLKLDGSISDLLTLADRSELEWPMNLSATDSFQSLFSNDVSNSSFERNFSGKQIFNSNDGGINLIDLSHLDGQEAGFSVSAQIKETSGKVRIYFKNGLPPYDNGVYADQGVDYFVSDARSIILTSDSDDLYVSQFRSKSTDVVVVDGGSRSVKLINGQLIDYPSNADPRDSLILESKISPSMRLWSARQTFLMDGTPLSKYLVSGEYRVFGGVHAYGGWINIENTNYRFANFETIKIDGSAGSYLDGISHVEKYVGGAGDDYLSGFFSPAYRDGAAFDTISGGAGNDILNVSANGPLSRTLKGRLILSSISGGGWE